MIKEKQLLEDALARKIISPEQFAQMDAMAETNVNRNPDERFRIVSGFSEVFISIGLLILLNASSALLWATLGIPHLTMVLASALAWVGAIYFTEHKRYMLPSIVCCIYSAHAMGSAAYAAQDKVPGLFASISKGDYWPAIYALIPAFAVLIAAAWRFRIPFLMLPIGVLFAAIVTLAGHAMQNDLSYRWLLAFCGITILAVALHFDLKDPHRVRRSSDFAFWCYVIGSPLTIHSLFLSYLMNSSWNHAAFGTLLPIALVAFSAIITVVALMLNRRALILSTLIYIAFSMGRFAAALGVQSVFVALIPMFLIGLYVVCLGTAWRRVRRGLMLRLTPRPWFSKLPPY